MNAFPPLLGAVALFAVLAIGCSQPSTPPQATSTTMPTATSSNSFSLTEAEWKARLTPAQFNVLRKKGTERSFTSDLLKIKDDGTYVCAGCDLALFAADSKFDSGTGWPSFTQPIKKEVVREKVDGSYGSTEIRSTKSDAHLGHVFTDGPKPNGLRYCMNSASLRFVGKEKMQELGYGEFLPLFAKADGK